MGERLTQGDIDKIKKEIEYRTLVVRKEAIEAVSEARAQGDLSENFEYYAAKKDKNKNESRIRYLERMLKNATVISDESQEVRCDSIEGKISIESPLGKAINGHKEGDRVYVKVNDKMGYYAVIRSITDGDDSEDEIRPY